MEQKTLLVFAGNMQQFSDYAKSIGKEAKCVYVTRPSDFYGRRNYSIVVMGTFGDKTRDYEVLEEARNYHGYEKENKDGN